MHRLVGRRTTRWHWPELLPAGIVQADARFYAASIVSVLGHLHSKGYIYRDLKPENILLDHLGRVKLCDLGFCRKMPADGSRAMSICGTESYIAPEALSGKGLRPVADWWGVGVLVYEMMTGVAPFEDDDPMVISLIRKQCFFLFWCELIHDVPSGLVIEEAESTSRAILVVEAEVGFIFSPWAASEESRTGEL